MGGCLVNKPSDGFLRLYVTPLPLLGQLWCRGPMGWVGNHKSTTRFGKIMRAELYVANVSPVSSPVVQASPVSRCLIPHPNKALFVIQSKTQVRLIYIALFLAPAIALPIDPRQVNVSPEISPEISLPSPVAECVGIAACNSITTNDVNQSQTPSNQQKQTPPPQQTGSCGGVGSLINVAPVINPSVDLPELLKCVGIATCNPVTVNKGEAAS
ncbi:hypothetical protein LZ30DRAFT_698377 [Colletotrichum cereale]|nr:hypothetical protein LZ30DRAFT_698377 [Colletotrichum cereale]